MNRSPHRPRERRHWRLALSLLLAAAASASAAAADPLHGAMPMAEQQQKLGALLPSEARPQPSTRIDPVIWGSMVPDDNALTPARVALGEKLYFDTRLSADNTVACATCHDVSRGFTDQRPVSEGIRDQLGRRNAPTVLNALLFQTLFLDGRSPSLENQAKQPIINPIEMGQPDGAAAVKAIAGDADYQARFKEAYGRAPNYEDVGRALAAFQRTLVFLDAPFDAFARGQTDAISAQAQEGWVLFNGKARCVSCHALNPSNPLGTDNRFHNIGVSARHQDFEQLATRAQAELAKNDSEQALDKLALSTDLSELGRFMITRDRSDIGAFKTSQLRNIGITAPYMHDGSMATLWDVMDHYNKGGETNPYLDGGIEPLALTESEIDAVVAFLFTLTDNRFAEQNAAIFAAQKASAATKRPFRDEALAMRRTLPWEARVTGGK
ncbi:MAG: cytochrome c peroxidase [Deltaproteobacteria bacterium]|nr:cytochrome c peroxidase [Deltaproteobacteria bacterium]